jgi:alkylation response protein AidB-like acyl-CoA dehydrogenase
LLFALTCAIATGNAEGAFTHAFKYASERYQGGEIIINHKIIQTLLGRIITRIEASLALTEKILNSAQAQNFDKAGIAKAFVTEACEWACSDCVQVFGGYGYMKDFSVERHLRDAKSLSGLLQGNMYNLQDYVRGLKEQGGTA